MLHSNFDLLSWVYFDQICQAFHLTCIHFFYRMCRALMPGDEEGMSDEAIWETLPVSIKLVALLSKDWLILLMNNGCEVIWKSFSFFKYIFCNILFLLLKRMLMFQMKNRMTNNVLRWLSVENFLTWCDVRSKIFFFLGGGWLWGVGWVGRFANRSNGCEWTELSWVLGC